MAVYSFECKDCSHRWDEVMSMTDYLKLIDQDGGFKCPNCESKRILRIFNTFSVDWKAGDKTIGT